MVFLSTASKSDQEVNPGDRRRQHHWRTPDRCHQDRHLRVNHQLQHEAGRRQPAGRRSHAGGRFRTIGTHRLYGFAPAMNVSLNPSGSVIENERVPQPSCGS